MRFIVFGVKQHRKSRQSIIPQFHARSNALNTGPSRTAAIAPRAEFRITRPRPGGYPPLGAGRAVARVGPAPGGARMELLFPAGMASRGFPFYGNHPARNIMYSGIVIMEIRVVTATVTVA